MRRGFPIVVLTLLAAGPLVAAPRLKPRTPPAVPPLAGTAWAGKTAEGWDMTIEFQAEGKMAVSYNGASYNRASWKQDGEKVYFEMNDKYCEFDGKLAGDTIEGESRNVTGKTWSTKLSKVVRDR